MKNFNAKGYEFRRYFQCFLAGAALILIHPAYAACDANTIDCQNTTIKNLKQQIELLEIDNAELRYDNDDLRERLKATKKKLDLCSINLKNVTVEIQSCGK